jgi:hypothetical protein
VDICCQYQDHVIVLGQEVLLSSLDECTENVARCELPEDDDAPLVPVVEVQF